MTAEARPRSAVVLTSDPSPSIIHALRDSYTINLLTVSKLPLSGAGWGKRGEGRTDVFLAPARSGSCQDGAEGCSLRFLGSLSLFLRPKIPQKTPGTSTGCYAKIGRTTWPLTSVRRKSRPEWRNVRRSWSRPNRCRIVACRS